MKSKKKMNLLAKQSASGWVFLTPGDDFDRSHGVLADDSGVHHVAADRFQCEHEMVRSDF